MLSSPPAARVARTPAEPATAWPAAAGAPAATGRRRRRALRGSPVAQFALLGLLATVAIGAVGMEVGRHIGMENAIRDAKQSSRLAGRGIVAAAVTDRVARGDAGAIADLDRLVRDHVLRDGVVRVKVWASDGRVVYSDEPHLIGRRFRLGADERAAVAHGDGVEAEVSHLARPENRFESDADRKLLEVYLPIRGADGKPYLFESYQRFSTVAAGGRRLWTAFAPALLGLLLLLQLVNLPLARSLALRLRRGSEEREALLQRAVDASEMERRVIAADLHDGVVQDLVSVGLGLEARARELEMDGHREASCAMRDGATQTRDGVRALRTLLVDIYPPRLKEAGLAGALDDLAATTTARGVRTTVVAAPGHDLPDTAARLLFRCAQEALRNTLKHARAAHAWIVFVEEGGRVVMEVADDGAGFEVAARLGRAPDGHIGLQALADLVGNAGGRLDVRSTAGEGTTVSVELPVGC